MRVRGGGGSTTVQEGSSGEDGQGLRVGTQVTCEGWTKETEKDRPKKQGQDGQSQQRDGLEVWQWEGMMSVRYEDWMWAEEIESKYNQFFQQLGCEENARESSLWKVENFTFHSARLQSGYSPGSVPAITKACHLRAWDSSSSPVTSLRASCDPPKPAQAHHSMKSSASVDQKKSGGMKTMTEIQNLKKEPARPTTLPF